MPDKMPVKKPNKSSMKYPMKYTMKYTIQHEINKGQIEKYNVKDTKKAWYNDKKLQKIKDKINDKAHNKY